MNFPGKKQMIAIAMVVAITVLLAALILMKGTAHSEGASGKHADHAQDESSHEAGHEATANANPGAPKRGPHRGKLFEKDGYGIELTIFEDNVAPEFRVYAYRDGKLLDPATSKVDVMVERLGRAPQIFAFQKENDYLKGNGVVEEPHSFNVTITAQHGQKTYRFGYDQIEARVGMTDEQVRQNGIAVATAGPGRIQSVLQLIGEIHLNQDRSVQIVPRVAGLVASVTASAGDQVRKGQLLAVMSSQALVGLRSQLQAAEKRAQFAATVYVREKMLWEEKISAQQDFIQAQSAKQEADIAVQDARQQLLALGAGNARGDLARYEIRAPINGTITEKRITTGEAVKEDSAIFVVADLSSVWAEMTVQAKDINTVKVGQKVKVTAGAFEHAAEATVAYVGALVGEQSRSATARVVLANPGGLWRPGLLVNIALVAGETDVLVAVANDAIQSVNDTPTVFGRYGSSFEARPVELGSTDGRVTEITKGLLPGERYAAKNSFLLKADLGKSGASHDH